MTTTTITVTGMTCGHCAAAVTEELTALPAVTSVDVGLVPGGESAVTITSDGVLDEQQIDAAIDEAGYQVRR